MRRLRQCGQESQDHRTIWRVFGTECPTDPQTVRWVQRGASLGLEDLPDAIRQQLASRAVGRPVEIQAYANRIVIRQDGAWSRLFGTGPPAKFSAFVAQRLDTLRLCCQHRGFDPRFRGGRLFALSGGWRGRAVRIAVS